MKNNLLFFALAFGPLLSSAQTTAGDDLLKARSRYYDGATVIVIGMATPFFPHLIHYSKDVNDPIYLRSQRNFAIAGSAITLTGLIMQFTHMHFIGTAGQKLNDAQKPALSIGTGPDGVRAVLEF